MRNFFFSNLRLTGRRICLSDFSPGLDVIQTTALNTPVGSEMAANVRDMDAFNCAGTATKNYKVFTWSFPGGTAGEETFSISKF